MPLLLKVDLKSFFSFNCSDSSFSVSSWKYIDGSVVLSVDYRTDLEGKQATVNFSFDQLIIRSPPIRFEFTI